MAGAVLADGVFAAGAVGVATCAGNALTLGAGALAYLDAIDVHALTIAAGQARRAVAVAGACDDVAGLAKRALADVIARDGAELRDDVGAENLFLLTARRRIVVGIEVVECVGGTREVVTQADRVANLVL